MEKKEVSQNWQILKQHPILEHPFLTVAMEQVQLPDGHIIEEWPKVYTPDYVSALILNKQGEAMVIEGYKHGVGSSCWQMMGGFIEEDEDPITAVQRELQEETGYVCDDWIYLGSFIVDVNRHMGTGYFFCAQGAEKKMEAHLPDMEQSQIKWVSLRDLRYALLDGRIAGISHGMTVTLALLTILD